MTVDGNRVRVALLFTAAISVGVAVVSAQIKSSTSSEASSTTVSGETFHLNDKGEYQPLRNVQITGFRAQGRVTPMGSHSGEAGRFYFNVPAGDPFTLVFYGEGVMPELQQLAGKQQTVSQVNVALLTLTQYERINKGGPSARERLSCMKAELARGGEATRDVRAAIDKILESLPKATSTSAR